MHRLDGSQRDPNAVAESHFGSLNTMASNRSNNRSNRPLISTNS
jgi:hypothetical protein